MLMQNFGVTNKEHYGMLWYFWSCQWRYTARHASVTDRYALNNLLQGILKAIRNQIF